MQQGTGKHAGFSGAAPRQPVAVEACLELAGVNNPAVERGSPPCGINKTEELVKGMVEARKVQIPPPFLS